MFKDKIKKRILLCAGIFFLLFLANCAGTAYPLKEKNINKIVKLIQEDKYEKLSELSRQPFLIDQEIFYLKKDIKLFWQGLTEAEINLADSEYPKINYIEKDSYQLFSTSDEIDMFFKQHVPKKSVIVKLQSEKNAFLLLLYAQKGFYPQIQGIKGPLP